uniref:UBC core domain-containing protein n=1 Tax=Odontella aurita TaxID=265563 RepID=A0A7S4NIU7_9STRA
MAKEGNEEEEEGAAVDAKADLAPPATAESIPRAESSIEEEEEDGSEGTKDNMGEEAAGTDEAEATDEAETEAEEVVPAEIVAAAATNAVSSDAAPQRESFDDGEAEAEAAAAATAEFSVGQAPSEGGSRASGTDAAEEGAVPKKEEVRHHGDGTLASAPAEDESAVLVAPGAADASDGGISKAGEEEEEEVGRSADLEAAGDGASVGSAPPAAKNEKAAFGDVVEPRKKTRSKSAEENRAAARASASATKKNKRDAAAADALRKTAAKKRSRREAGAPVGGGRGGECLRRIKREWRDAVRLGIAYDWICMKTVESSRRGGVEGEDEGTAAEERRKYNYVRMGPLGRNLLRWHFSVAGPPSSPYEGGVYHGRVCLPKDYPGSPPRVQMLTPSGRFVPGHDICLSASSYHPETWTPRWTVLSLVDALRLHMLTTPNEIGGVYASDERRRELAERSRTWKWARGGVADHGMMIREGIFAAESDEEETAEGSGEGFDVSSPAVEGNETAAVPASFPALGENAIDDAASSPEVPPPSSTGSAATSTTKKRRSKKRRKRKKSPSSPTTKIRRRSAETFEPARRLSTGEIVARALVRGVADVLRSPVKLLIVIFTVIFTALNSRQ